MSVATPETYLADLNEAQREAVLATEGPLLVVAGAGSGKTRVLTYRVAHLIRACGVKPNEILAITFTNKAAGEMRERLERMLGQTARAIWILTFHAACGRMLRREAERLGYRSTFTIYDDQDQVRLVKACLEELGKDPKRFSPRGIHAQISRAKNELVSPEEYTARVASFWDQTVAEAYELYQRRLHASNAVDFDDLLMLTVQVFERFPEALERWRKAFRYVLVDEYQDTNHAQYRLLQLLGGVRSRRHPFLSDARYRSAVRRRSRRLEWGRARRHPDRYPTSAVDARIHRYWTVLAIIAAVVLAVAATVAAVLARWVTRPLDRLERAATRSAAGVSAASPPQPEGPPRSAAARGDVQLDGATELDTLHPLAGRVRRRRGPASCERRCAALRLRLENLEPDVADPGKGGSVGRAA